MGNLFTCTMYDDMDPMDGQLMFKRTDCKKKTYHRSSGKKITYHQSYRKKITIKK
jgi:hypothetical protein